MGYIPEEMMRAGSETEAGRMESGRSLQRDAGGQMDRMGQLSRRVGRGDRKGP